MSHLMLYGTAACNMRDSLINARFDKKINLNQITTRLYDANIPYWLQAQIIQMNKHNIYKRMTNPIEIAMEKAVNMLIIDEIKSKNPNLC